MRASIQQHALTVLVLTFVGQFVRTDVRAALGAASAQRPLIEVSAPNTVITQSCRVVIPPGAVIRDVNDQGVILAGAPNIEIDFAQGSSSAGRRRTPGPTSTKVTASA